MAATTELRASYEPVAESVQGGQSSLAPGLHPRHGDGARGIPLGGFAWPSLCGAGRQLRFGQATRDNEQRGKSLGPDDRVCVMCELR